MKNDKILCDAAFEGGGIWGIGYVGAITKFEEKGYKFRNVAGTSAGSIVAALVAAGYSAAELRKEMQKAEFASFKELYYDQAGAFNMIVSLLGAKKNLGIYRARKLEDWIERLLDEKGVHTFGELGGRLKIVASDTTTGQKIVMPDDLAKYGKNPDNFSVAAAVRMSISIPLYFEPCTIRDKSGVEHQIVDGGITSNYPITTIDDNAKLDVPTFGFRFESSASGKSDKKPDLSDFTGRVLSTVITSQSNEVSKYIRGDKQRTVFIDTAVHGKEISPVNFSLTGKEFDGLYQNGVHAAENFLETWNFKDWQSTHRSQLHHIISTVGTGIKGVADTIADFVEK